MATLKTILIVDDEADLVRMLKARLASRGYRVLSAYDGETGLRMAYESRPDLILLDIRIPKKGGIEFYKEIRTERGRLKFPVLVLTARAELGDLFREIDADGFMKKPFETSALLREIERILGKSLRTDVFLCGLKDDARSQEIVDALQRELYKVVVVDDLNEFQELAPGHKPRFIAMEYLQRSMDGDTFIRQLRKTLADYSEESWPEVRTLPILVYSFSGMDYRTKSLDAGATAYLGKPPDCDAVVTAIRDLELKQREA